MAGDVSSPRKFAGPLGEIRGSARLPENPPAMNLKRHPTNEQLERFVLGRTGAEENRAIVLHLLASCPECRKVTRALWCRTESALAKLVLVALPEEIRTMRGQP
jgi:hypothetical protein